MDSEGLKCVTGELSRQLRVVLADDDPLARRAVRVALDCPGILVVAEATDGYEAVGLARYHRPDVLLLEADLPGPDAEQVIRRVVTHPRETHVVVLSTSPQEDAALQLLHAGASGFISKDGDIDTIAPALHSVVQGGAAVSDTVALRLIEHFRTVPRGGHGLRPIKSRLTNREWEIVDLLDSGADTHQIAEELVLTLDTVYTHVKNLMRKLGVHTRAEVVAAAAADRQATMLASPVRGVELSDDDIDALLRGRRADPRPALDADGPATLSGAA